MKKFKIVLSIITIIILVGLIPISIIGFISEIQLYNTWGVIFHPILLLLPFHWTTIVVLIAFLERYINKQINNYLGENYL